MFMGTFPVSQLGSTRVDVLANPIETGPMPCGIQVIGGRLQAFATCPLNRVDDAAAVQTTMLTEMKPG